MAETKERYLATCQHCKQVTDIRLSKAVQRLQTTENVLRESNSSLYRQLNFLRKQKVGQIQSMHKMIKQLYDIMAPDQRKQACLLSRQLRDELKGLEKKFPA